MELETKEIDGKKIQWLSEPDYRKAIFQLRSQLMNLMQPLEIYGQKPFVDEAIEQIISLTEDFALKVRGIDKPLISNPHHNFK